ncbi:MAG: hypothetical protein K8F25_06580 [Fimbriimonadaceae bacterium]|nr:hypothetical protein [Alphaproteobacteria bacterium]
MRHKANLLGAALALALSGPVLAAESWGIANEKITRADVKVVDLLCEVTGNCVDDCGAGKRQLGLLFDDGRLVPVVKNFDIFAGATVDLIQFCGQRITADGLLIENETMPLFALQFKKPLPDGDWSRANWWGGEWSKANGGKPSNNWYTVDPLVLSTIESDGVFGIPGLEPEE